MQISLFLKSFSRDKKAAVTVDWVVLTAALVVVALAVVSTISIGSNSASSTVSANIQTVANAASTT